MTSTIKKIIVWLVLVVALTLAFKYYDYQQKQTSFHLVTSNAEVALSRVQGHYFWPAEIKGNKLFFMVDSGATTTALPQNFVNRYLPDAPTVATTMVSTANGNVEVRVIEIDLALQGGLEIKRLRVTVLPKMDDDSALLGMDILSKVELIQRGKTLSVKFIK